MIARKMLESQLKRLGVLAENQEISDFSSFHTSYKISEFREFFFQFFFLYFVITGLIYFLYSVWANHGDEISIQYSGTPALKGDFTRYHFRSEICKLKNRKIEKTQIVIFHYFDF